MSHESGDGIDVRKGVGEILGVGLSLGRSLAINVGVSSVVGIALGGEVSSSGGGVGGVIGGYGAVSVVHKIGISLGFGGPLAINVGVSISGVSIALSGEVSSGGGGVGGVKGGDGAIGVMDKLSGSHGHETTEQLKMNDSVKYELEIERVLHRTSLFLDEH